MKEEVFTEEEKVTSYPTIMSGDHQEGDQTVEKSETIERTLKDIECIKNQYNLNLEEKQL